MPPPSKPALHKEGGVVDFPYDADTFSITEEMKQVYEYDGAIVIKSMFSKEEIARLNEVLTDNPIVTEKALQLADGQGRYSRLCLWNQPGTDVTGMVARCRKVVDSMEELLGGEVYHYHTKLLMKDARTGGTHIWHQDYGYWYQNSLLRPDVATAYIPLDPCRKENGCLEVVKGTNRCGRVDHSLQHGQQQADPDRVDWMCKNFEHVYAEMDPGDVLFFHSNLLHKAGKNDSDMRRWCFLVSYNRADNDPIVPHHHASYTPLSKVANDAILTCENTSDLSGKEFMEAGADKTTRSKEQAERGK